MFIEENCTVEHNGKEYTAGGAWLTQCTDGYYRGVVYSTWGKGSFVTDWHGKKIASARYGHKFRGNFCWMQYVSFEYEGIMFKGFYCPDWNQSIRVRSTKKYEIKEAA